MTDYEDLVRQEANRRGWTVEAHQNRISIAGVPYRTKDGASGRCQISVDTEDDGLSMRAPANGQDAAHAAVLRGVAGGCAYQATGEPVGNVLWTDEANACVISIKLDEGEYANAWHALSVYVARVAGEVGAEQRERVQRPFTFGILGEDSEDTRNWIDRERGQKVGIIGLGGVGLWILDIMSKTDVAEIRIWDGDEIEGRNLLRAPGWAAQDAIGQNKAEYFGERYRGVRTGISIFPEYLRAEESSDALQHLTFVFLAVDKVDIRAELCEKLEETKIPFADVGMGLKRQQGRVWGSCQVFFSGDDPGRWRVGIPTAQGAGDSDYYELQLADLGALNAALAVGMWRRHIGQYEEEERDWLTRYWIEKNDLIKRSEGP